MTPRTLLSASAVLCLVGCVTTPAQAPVVTEVRIPVRVPCDEPMPARPAYAVDALAIDADIGAQMRSLRAERRQRKGYEIELEAAAKACR
jgi:hypothetical protein